MTKTALRATAAIAILCTPISATAQEEPQLAPPSCDYGALHPNAPAETKQFDFLIGDYTIDAHIWWGDDWSPARPGTPPRWNGRYVLAGLAIEDEWFSVDPGVDPDAPSGINIRMWDPDAGEWDMMWISTAGREVQDLRAREIDGVLTMWQVYPERPSFRAYFERLGPDSWQRIALTLNEETGEWENAGKLVAKRIPCPAA